MDVICTNGSFSAKAMELYKEYGVVTPEENKMYSIRGTMKTTNGDIGVWLDELHNPKIPVQNPVFGNKAMVEPSWALLRFAKLNGDKISSEEIRELIKETA